MIKFSSRDVQAILQSFAMFTAKNSKSDISNLEIDHPDGSHSKIKFRYQHRNWYILVDNTADSDIDYIFQQLGYPDAEPVVLDDGSLQVSHRGKIAYLLRGPAEDARLDAWLSQQQPEISRATWQRHIQSGRILINGSLADSASTRVTPLDKIEINLPEPIDHSQKTLPIIYQDDHLIVINKPVGILTHAKGALSEEFTVADFFKSYTEWGLDTNRPGIVHRLDRATSGVLVGAKTAAAAKKLQKQFSERSVKKTYYALVDGHFDQPEAIIELPIERNPSKPSQFRVGASGKPAVTRYRVLSSGDNWSLVELKPSTGRTHQLRVHMSYLKHPIIGDVVYGGSKAERLYLHAYQLELTGPDSTRHLFQADLPSEFKGYLP